MRMKLSQSLRNVLLLLTVSVVTVIVTKVRNNREALAPYRGIYIAPTSAPIPVKPLAACSPQQRRDYLKNTCQEMGISKRPPSRESLRIIVTDDEKKLLYCLLPKSGSKSWLFYMIKLAGKVRPGHWHVRKPEFMKKAGLNFLRDVSVEEINTRYRDYYKFAVVRHPLQRLVSAYYEAIGKQRHFNTDGKAPSFAEFGDRLVKDMPPQLHWMTFIDDCQFCHIDYDFIIKAETVAGDTDALNDDLGQNVSLEYRHSNLMYDDNIEVLDHHNFKYDHVYRDLRLSGQHNAFANILKVYEADLRLHGYNWDNSAMSSTCEIDIGDSKTCC